MAGSRYAWIGAGRWKAFITITCIFIVTCDGGDVQALPAEAHALISYQAGQLEGLPEEIRQHLGPYDPVPQLSSMENICQGAVDEDWDRDPRQDPWERDRWVGLFNWGTHFWDPSAGPLASHGKLIYVTTPIAGTMRVNRGLHPTESCAGQLNAYERGAWLFNQAVREYDPESPAYSYYLLGKVSHLLVDVATPAHVHLDIHGVPGNGDDSYETYMKRYDYVEYSNTALEQFRIDYVEPYNLSPVNPSELHHGGHPERDELYRLFWNMATLAAAYDSDDVNGTMTQGSMRFCSGPENDISDEDCAVIAEALVPVAIEYVGGLYNLFWARTHSNDGPPQLVSFTLSPSPAKQNQALTFRADYLSDEGEHVLAVDFFRDTNFNGILDLGVDEYVGFGVPNEQEAVLDKMVNWPVGTHRFFAQSVDSQGRVNTVAAMTARIVSENGEAPAAVDTCNYAGDLQSDQVCGIGIPPIMCLTVFGFVFMRMVPAGYGNFRLRRRRHSP